MTWRGLSLTQPWATACVYRGADRSRPFALKRIETRSWPTRYRGPLLIHAAMNFPAPAREVASRMRQRGRLPAILLPRGAVIGSVTLVDCVPTEELVARGLDPLEREWGDYSPGRFGFVFEDARPFIVPIPFKGTLGLWTAPAELERRVPR